jgi:hypothetical protein
MLAISGTYSHKFLVRSRRDICGLIQRQQKITQQQNNKVDRVKLELSDSCELESVSYSSWLKDITDGNRFQLLGQDKAGEYEKGSIQGLASNTAMAGFDFVSARRRALKNVILLRSDRSSWLQTHDISLMAYCYTATGTDEKTSKRGMNNGQYSSAEIDREIITTFKV